jgi:hypothetical protein
MIGVGQDAILRPDCKSGLRAGLQPDSACSAVGVPSPSILAGGGGIDELDIHIPADALDEPVKPLFPGRVSAGWMAFVAYWLDIVARGAALYTSWVCALGSGLVKEDLPPEASAAIKRRILTGQSWYAVAALLCVFDTRWSIAMIVLVQRNFAIAPRGPRSGHGRVLNADSGNDSTGRALSYQWKTRGNSGRKSNSLPSRPASNCSPIKCSDPVSRVITLWSAMACVTEVAASEGHTT